MGRHSELESCSLACVTVAEIEVRAASPSEQTGKLATAENKDKEKRNG